MEAITPLPHRIPAQKMIREILVEMRKSPDRPLDIAETARLCGISESTFRRYWSQVIPEPPRRYLETLRIQEACRELADSERSIKEIAHSLGFEDELYFSRRFHRRRGISPREYRERHRA